MCYIACGLKTRPCLITLSHSLFFFLLFFKTNNKKTLKTKFSSRQQFLLLLFINALLTSAKSPHHNLSNSSEVSSWGVPYQICGKWCKWTAIQCIHPPLRWQQESFWVPNDWVCICICTAKNNSLADQDKAKNSIFGLLGVPYLILTFFQEFAKPKLMQAAKGDRNSLQLRIYRTFHIYSL